MQALLDEVFGRQAALKEELVDAHRDVVASLRRHTETRLSEIATTAREVRFCFHLIEYVSYVCLCRRES